VERRLRFLLHRIERADLRLTAVDPDRAWERHILDSLAGVPVIAGEPAGALVDVGSGAGLPGLALAICDPGRPTHLIESHARRAAFLRDTAVDLGLTNVTVHPCRSEEVAAGAMRETFAVATCRALAAPAVAAELCLPLVRPGGLFLLYAGAVDESALAAAADTLGGRIEGTLPVAGSDRRQLVSVRKRAETPARFPRRPGIAAKRPLGAGAVRPPG
jgi:16S rRNA (guanine527-N7)-methyltransferase